MGISGVQNGSPALNAQHRCQCVDDLLAPIRSRMKVLKKIKKRIRLSKCTVNCFCSGSRVRLGFRVKSLRFFFLSLSLLALRQFPESIVHAMGSCGNNREWYTLLHN